MANRAEHIKYMRSTNARNSMMSALGICRITLNDDFTIAHLSHVNPLLGVLMDDGRNIFDYDIDSSVKDYFRSMMSLKKQIIEDSENCKDESWVCAFSSSNEAAPFASWHDLSGGAWEKDGQIAQAKTSAELKECYLMSDRELIGPTDDFRIEYIVCADGDPSDLSLVIAREGSLWQSEVFHERPDGDGYCFAFGAVSNRVTELQRSLLMIASTDDVVIKRGKDHHCVAERIGGVLRFVVDDKEAWRVLDTMPIMGAGHGYVGFYTLGDCHKFKDLNVWTRPTCLKDDTRRMRDSLQGQVLHCPDSPCKYLEAHYLGGNMFVFKDVADAVLARQRLEEELRAAEKKDVLLKLASAAAHEMNQPLTVILGHVGLLLSESSGDQSDVMNQNLTDLKESSERLAKIVREIGGIQHFATKAYAGDSEVLDIHASCDS